MKLFKRISDGVTGKVVSYKGVTTTLQFDDGSNLIVTPAQLKNEWQLVKDDGSSHVMSYSELASYMMQYNSEHDQDKASLYAVIVITSDSFTKNYTEVERSYRVHNANRMFQHDKIANSLFGDCLDGTDNGVRLDWYIGDGWKVDYCYVEGE